MKKMLIFLCLFMLCGCVSNYDIDRDKIDEVLSFTDNEILFEENTHTKYYSYYLPSDMQEYYDEDNLVLTLGSAKIVANINISNIIAKNYYQDGFMLDESFFNENYLYYRKSGTFTNVDGEVKDFRISIYENDGYYGLNFMTSDMNYYAFCLGGDLVNVVSHLLLVGRCTSVDERLVIDDFSNKETIDYNKKQVDLFDFIIPSEGRVEDLLINQEPPVEEISSNLED